MVQSVTSPGKSSSTTVVEVGLRATLNGQIYRTQVRRRNFSGDRFVRSVTPKTPLNAAVDVVRVYLRRGGESQDTDNKKNQLDREVSTADLLRRDKVHTGMKTRSKMVLLVDRQQSEGNAAADNSAKLVFRHFSLQGVTESDDERYQIHETFAGEVMFVFGRRPRIWTLAGVVVNSADAPYADELLKNYDELYRGTRLVEERGRAIVTYEDIIIEGTLVGLTVARNSQVPSAVNVSLSLVVHERGFMSLPLTEDTDPSVAKMLSENQELAGFSLNRGELNADQIGRLIGPQALKAEKEKSAKALAEANRVLTEKQLEKDIVISDLNSTSEAITETEQRIEELRAAIEYELISGLGDPTKYERELSREYDRLEEKEARFQSLSAQAADADAAVQNASLAADAAQAENEYWNGQQSATERAATATAAAAAATSQSAQSGTQAPAAAPSTPAASPPKTAAEGVSSSTASTAPPPEPVSVIAEVTFSRSGNQYSVTTTVKSEDGSSQARTESGGVSDVKFFRSREDAAAYAKSNFGADIDSSSGYSQSSSKTRGFLL